MLSLLESTNKQIPLIHFFHEDDVVLLNSTDAKWYEILYHFPWESYREYGAKYYNALYEFNIREAEKSQEKVNEANLTNFESKDEAKTRLLFNRETMKEASEGKGTILFEVEAEECRDPHISEKDISPGVVPFRLAGKKPKCFFSLLKCFLGTTLMGYPPEPESVHFMLTSNPSFVRVCGFVPGRVGKDYSYQDVPSLRKLQQFDQIMTGWGIWDILKWDEVIKNLKDGVIAKEKELVGDTTHYYSYSSFETLAYQDEKGKDKKKSQSKVTKNCRCKDREKCSHQWVLADDGSGTVVKSKHKMYWAHKASVLGFPIQGVPLDISAVSDGATHDGETFYPHVKKLLDKIPSIAPWIARVLYDSACDDKTLKEKFKKDFEIELKASLNPRRKKEVTEGLPRGIDKLTPYGVPICEKEYEMDYKGARYENEKFIFQAPEEDGASVCMKCEKKADCCPNSTTGRTINISFDLLPHIDPNDPPMAKRFKAIMTRRPSVERMIKRIKIDLGDDRLSKRGNASFQAYLDKTMIAFHILLRN